MSSSPVSLCPVNSLPCHNSHIACFPWHKLCVYELDIEQELQHCRNGFHVSNCEEFACDDMFKCPDSYCIPVHYLCDHYSHCPNGEDEDFCNTNITLICQPHQLLETPSYVQQNLLNDSCIPAILPTTVISDDEDSVEVVNLLSCPGLFRCQWGQCVHPSLLCDGIVHCPLFADDETNCIVDNCSIGCQCTGKSVYCTNTTYHTIPLLPVNMKTLVFKKTYQFIRLNRQLEKYIYPQKLDLSENMINRLTEYASTDLKVCSILIHQETPSFRANNHLVFQNLSRNNIAYIQPYTFVSAPSLKFLSLILSFNLVFSTPVPVFSVSEAQIMLREPGLEDVTGQSDVSLGIIGCLQLSLIDNICYGSMFWKGACFLNLPYSISPYCACL